METPATSFAAEAAARARRRAIAAGAPLMEALATSFAELKTTVADFETKKTDFPSVRHQLFTFCEAVDAMRPESSALQQFRKQVQSYHDGDLKTPWVTIKTMLPDIEIALTKLASPSPDYCIELVRGNVRVTLDWIGEGEDGNYDENQDDRPLMRFDVYRRQGIEWEPIDDASYCTNVDRDADIKDKLQVVEEIMNDVRALVEGGHSIKKTCTRLSWKTAGRSAATPRPKA